MSVKKIFESLKRLEESSKDWSFSAYRGDGGNHQVRFNGNQFKQLSKDYPENFRETATGVKSYVSKLSDQSIEDSDSIPGILFNELVKQFGFNRGHGGSYYSDIKVSGNVRDWCDYVSGAGLFKDQKSSNRFTEREVRYLLDKILVKAVDSVGGVVTPRGEVTDSVDGLELDGKPFDYDDIVFIKNDNKVTSDLGSNYVPNHDRDVDALLSEDDFKKWLINKKQDTGKLGLVFGPIKYDRDYIVVLGDTIIPVKGIPLRYYNDNYK